MDCTYIPVGTNNSYDYHIRRDPFNVYKGAPSYNFYMKDKNAKHVELTATFATQSDIDEAGLTESQISEHKNANSI